MSRIPRFAFLLILCTPSFGAPQFLFDSGSVHDEPLNGVGDTINLDTELITRTIIYEDRAMREFYAGEFVGLPPTSATVSGTISPSDLTDVGVRTFEFTLYSSNGNVSESDYNHAGIPFGSVSYHPPTDTVLNYSLDATVAAQTLLVMGGAFLGIRVECTTSSPGDRLDDSTASFLIIGFDAESPFCFGDGGFVPGCTDCPCGNNAPPVAISGGCLNGFGTFAKLFRSGTASLSNDSLTMFVDGANPNGFAILASADNRLPANPANPCFGLDSGFSSNSHDGLRCIGGNLRRHGGRAVDAFGSVVTPWGMGGGPVGGLVAQGGFAAGTQRSFQCIYREQLNLVCGTGLNTSNGVTVSIVP